MIEDLKEQERLKYERVWEHQFYRAQADGLGLVDFAFERMGCKPGESLIDWGCGCGTPAAKFAEYGLTVVGVDIAHNCLNPDVDIPLVVGCMWEHVNLPTGLEADYSFCTDVLEHIPIPYLSDAISTIWWRTRKAALIQVCTRPDISGARMDPPMKLHLSVFGEKYWEGKLLKLWERVVPVGAAGNQRSAFLCFKR